MLGLEVILCLKQTKSVRQPGVLPCAFPGAMATIAPESSVHLELSTLGDHPVQSTVLCAISRFGLRSIFDLLLTYLDYRRVLRQAQASNTPGLLRAAFLIENLTTCYSVSFWDSRHSIALFGTRVPKHIDAARKVLGRLSIARGRGPELWSTKWQLVSVSSNLNWEDWDLRSLILSMDR